MGIVRRLRVKGVVYDIGVNWPYRTASIAAGASFSVECSMLFGYIYNGQNTLNTVSYGMTMVGMNANGGVSISFPGANVSLYLKDGDLYEKRFIDATFGEITDTFGEASETWEDYSNADSPISVNVTPSAHSGWYNLSITNKTSEGMLFLYNANK